MANKGVGGGRGRSGGGSRSGTGGGKSRPGPRQPAGRKQGSAGPVKTGLRGSGPKTPGAAGGGRPAGEARGRSFAAAGRGTGRASSDDRPPRRGAASGSSWDKGPGRPARQGQDAGRGRSGGPGTGGRGTGGPGTGGRGYERKTGTGAGPKTDRGGQGTRTGRGDAARPPRRTPVAGQARPERGAPRREPRHEKAPDTTAVRHVHDKAALSEQDWHTTELEGKVVGLNPVLELLKSGGRKIDTVFIDSAKGGKLFNDIMSSARQLGITVKLVPKPALDGMSPGLRHQGAVAVVSPKEYADPDELVDSAFAVKPKPVFVLLDGVEDPQNLGSVIRSVDAAGADGVFIPEHRAAHLSASVARASAGALEHVPVAKVKNMAGFIDTLKDKGVWVVCVEGGTGKGYTGFNMDVPVALVLGSEGAGVRSVVRKVCDETVSLPMLGKVNSLNVSVAAGVMLYEVLRQRGQNKLD